MPSQPYNLVKDEPDLRVPLHSDESFYTGISFQAKLIGFQEVPRPTSRSEIVQAMRRIRYENKTQNSKKKKVTIEISVDGVRICLKKRKRRMRVKKSQNWSGDLGEIELFQHPIYRIFYVSHDSSDLKIFSYIARDGSTDRFKCMVFKSNKKSQAMKVVRTVGQAFEVCHKLSIQKKQDNNDDISEINSELDQSDIQNLSDFDEPKKALETTPILQDSPLKLQRPTQLENLSTPLNNLMAPPSPNKVTTPSDDSNKENSREFHMIKEQLQQQTQQTKQALAQLILVREQLLTETNARIEAQARTQQLLQQNRELLEHIASLSGLNESDRPGLSSANIGMAPQQQLPLYLQTLSLLGGQNMMKHDFMQNEDMKNNNSPHKINQNGNIGGGGVGGGLNIDSFQIFQNTMQAYNQLNQMNQQKQMGMPQQHQELYQLNQELINRIKNLNVGFQTPSTTPVSAAFTPSPTTGLPNFPADSNFMFTNAAAQNFLNNNNINNTNSTVNASSPLGTLNRSSSTYSTISPIGDSFDRSLDNLNNNHNTSLSFNDSAFIKPLSQVGAVTTLETDGRVKVLVPVEHQQQQQQSNRERDRYRVEDDFFGDRRSGGSSGTATLQRPPTQPRALTPILSRGEKKSQGNTVTLKVTDEAGNVTNQRKLPAQPSFITRSTSEKVPNRSQMMSHVQRTQWARHTTK